MYRWLPVSSLYTLGSHRGSTASLAKRDCASQPNCVELELSWSEAACLWPPVRLCRATPFVHLLHHTERNVPLFGMRCWRYPSERLQCLLHQTFRACRLAPPDASRSLALAHGHVFARKFEGSEAMDRALKPFVDPSNLTARAGDIHHRKIYDDE